MSVCQLGILLCLRSSERLMGIGSVVGKLFTDKLVYGWLEVLGDWPLDSATTVIIAYPAHARG
jgi:hypothetical protein